MVDIVKLRQIQQRLAAQVVLQDNFATPLWIAGADVGFEQNGSITRAVIVVLHYPSQVLVEYRIVHLATQFPYIPGFLSFRELPALLTAWRKLLHRPQLVLVDGHGIMHPRCLGIASHFGILADVTTIGVAKRPLVRHHLSEGAPICLPIREKGKQIGWKWQSKVGCRPLYISPGHHITLESALTWVQHCMRGYRLPEPIRWADSIASQRAHLRNFCLDTEEIEQCCTADVYAIEQLSLCS